MNDTQVTYKARHTVRVKTPYAVGGIIVNIGGEVIESAPIFKWMIGKHMTNIGNYLKNNGGSYEVIESEEWVEHDRTR